MDINLWAALEDAIGPAPTRTRPVGSVTVAEFKEHYGVSESTAARRLADAVKAGRMTATQVILDGSLVKCFTPCTPTSANSARTKKTK